MKSLLFLAFIFSISHSIAQEKTIDSSHLAKVNDWNKISYQVNDEFWSSAKSDIVKQIGEMELLKI